MVKYKTIKSFDILSENELKQLGKESWCLGGIITKEVVIQDTLDDRHRIVKLGGIHTCYYYHFWKKA